MASLPGPQIRPRQRWRGLAISGPCGGWTLPTGGCWLTTLLSLPAVPLPGDTVGIVVVIGGPLACRRSPWPRSARGRTSGQSGDRSEARGFALPRRRGVAARRNGDLAGAGGVVYVRISTLTLACRIADDPYHGPAHHRRPGRQCRAAGAGPRATACHRATTRRARRPAAQRQSARQPPPGAALRGEGAGDGLRLPGAGDGEWAVQVPWRKKHRATDGGGPRQRGAGAHHAREVHTSGAWHGTLGA